MSPVSTPDLSAAPNASEPPACRICGHTREHRFHQVREMMLGLPGTFPYLECGRCGCLQLQQIPPNMTPYYPADYYSFDRHGPLMTFLRRRRAAHGLGRWNVVGWLLSECVLPNDATRAIQRAGVGADARILDVGCGSGRLLLDLAWLGYRHLTGIDPFIAADIQHPEGPRVWKRRIEDLEGEFDLVMLHHSFEHMDHPQEVMRAVTRLLRSGGQAIIRIPVASSFAWRQYGVHWVNLDAPRHFFLHTAASMEILASAAGLQPGPVVHEGNAEQFWASQQYARGIPMRDPRSLKSRRLAHLLAWPRLRRMQARAEELNRQGLGDLLCFHYRRP